MSQMGQSLSIDMNRAEQVLRDCRKWRQMRNVLIVLLCALMIVFFSGCNRKACKRLCECYEDNSDECVEECEDELDDMSKACQRKTRKLARCLDRNDCDEDECEDEIEEWDDECMDEAYYSPPDYYK
jgi:hypothetical protein